LQLSDTLFKVVGIDDSNDELFEMYLQKTSELAELAIVRDRTLLENRAEEIYSFLMINRSNNK
jgi:hypothetical protein